MGFFDTLKEKISGKENKAKYLAGFSNTASNFRKKLHASDYLNGPVEFLEYLLEVLINADLGFKTADKIVALFDSKAKIHAIFDSSHLRDDLLLSMQEVYNAKNDKPLNVNENGPTVNLIIGVNGAGKTTSIAKLANMYIKQGKSVLLVAADTFRAGAREQLTMWADRLGCEIAGGKDNADPSSVIVDGLRKAKELNVDIVLCDTAGRLQNKVNLMNELEKMHKVAGREIPGAPHNSLLVIDSNTGQNGLSQASMFNEITDINGVILTKMDGTAKGGIVLAIKDQVGIPVRYIGVGEGIEDLKEFDLDLYLYSIMGDL